MRPHPVCAGALAADQDGWVLAHNVARPESKGYLARKGEVLTPELRDRLSVLSDRELHLLEPEPGDLHEDEAGLRVAKAVSGPGIRLRGPAESQYELLADRRGLLRVRGEILRQVNALDGLSILTRFDYQPVNENDPLAGVKVTPILIPAATIEAAERVCRPQPPLEVLAFLPLRVGVLVAEKIDARNRERFRKALERKLSWYGGTLEALLETENDREAFSARLAELATQNLDLIMVAGASSLDPLEPLFRALQRLEARIVKHGVPVHPGSLFWIVDVHGTPLFGLSSCEMFSHKTILDLILPRLFAGLPVQREDLVELGHGGMLGHEMAFRFPPYP